MKKCLCVLIEVDANEVEQGSNLEFNCKSPKVTATVETISPSLPSSPKVLKRKKLKWIQVVEISPNTSNDGENAHEE
jgi:hypothetical protein